MPPSILPYYLAETFVCVLSSLVTGSRSHKLVTSDVSRILWYYYNDSVRSQECPNYYSLLTLDVSSGRSL